MRNDFIMTMHISRTMNVETHAESRSLETRTERELNEAYFHSILNHFKSNFSAHLFALQLNTQLPRFFSNQLDPDA